MIECATIHARHVAISLLLSFVINRSRKIRLILVESDVNFDIFERRDFPAVAVEEAIP